MEWWHELHQEGYPKVLPEGDEQNEVETLFYQLRFCTQIFKGRDIIMGATLFVRLCFHN